MPRAAKYTSISMLLPILAGLAHTQANAQQVARDLKVEYQKTGPGTYTALLHNKHSADATAYIAQATFRLEGKQKPTAFGGDTLSNPGGGYSLPPGSVTEGNSLPPHAEPLTAGVLAVIYADGFSEGDEDGVQMMLAGRHRSYLDLQTAIPLLRDGAAGKIETAALIQRFEEMRKADAADADQLDAMIDIPSLRHKYFMSAVPSQALQMLQRPQASLDQIASQFEQWMRALAASKPDIR